MADFGAHSAWRVPVSSQTLLVLLQTEASKQSPEPCHHRVLEFQPLAATASTPSSLTREGSQSLNWEHPFRCSVVGAPTTAEHTGPSRHSQSRSSSRSSPASTHPAGTTQPARQGGHPFKLGSCQSPQRQRSTLTSTSARSTSSSGASSRLRTLHAAT